MVKRGVIVFGEDWGAHPSATQHLFRRLGAERDVIWVNSLGLRRPRMDARDLSRVATKIGRGLLGRSARSAPQALPASMSIIDPFAISWPGSRMAATVNRLSVGRQLRACAADRRMKRPIYWSSLPSAMPILEDQREGPIIYYCGDDFGALAGVDHGPVKEMEARLAERADLILAASATLAERFPASKTVTLPHGVDFDLFATPAPRAADLPSGKPIAGFYGSLAEWVDLDLILDVATMAPDWNIVLIGQPSVDIAALRARPNIHLLGPRPHADLPAYVQHWDVSLLPFRRNAQIFSCDPLKLREYLAAGTPIVATPFPALEPYRAHLRVARTGADFVAAIRSAVDDEDAKTARRMSVAKESWAARAELISSLMDRL